MADAIDLGSITVQVWRFESSRRHHDVAGSGARGLAGRRLLCKEKFVGSNPTGSTLCQCQYRQYYRCGRSSVVERLLAKEKVVSSNLIARSQRVGHAADPFEENLIGRGSSVGRAQH